MKGVKKNLQGVKKNLRERNRARDTSARTELTQRP